MFISLRVKLLLAFTLLFSAVFAGAYYWFYTYSTNTATQRVTEDLDTLLKNTAMRINGDNFAKLAADTTVRDDGYSDNPLYWAHVQELATTQSIDPRARLYTFITTDDPNKILFVGSGSAIKTPPSGAKFREECVHQPGPDDCGDVSYNVKAITDGVLVDQPGTYTDKFGEWLSSYYPIRDSSNKIVGALGVDFEGSYIRNVQKGILNSLIVAFALTYAFLFITVFIISGSMTRPVIGLTRVASRIGEGDYNQNLARFTKTRVKDEITTLATVFDIMVSKVAKREEKLKEQVVQLQIQIDHGKRDKDVQEIVESDFFQELQSKAQKMRVRMVEHSGMTGEFKIPTAPTPAGEPVKPSMEPVSSKADAGTVKAAKSKPTSKKSDK